MTWALMRFLGACGSRTGGTVEIKEEHLPQILAEYERLAQLYLERQQEGRGFNFFHFNVELKKGPCLYNGCRGAEQVSNIWPYHPRVSCIPPSIVGRDELGSAMFGTGCKTRASRHSQRQPRTQQACLQNLLGEDYCSGGCHANNLFHADSFTEPYSIT